LERHSFTVLERPAALQKLARYFREKVRATGSVSSMSMFVSGFSTSVFGRRVTDPLPISPAQENLIPSLEVSMETAQGEELDVASHNRWHYLPDSERAIKSTQIRLNSLDGIVTVAAYSVSGIPKCS
jgi:hypothetical protein